jgi:hypothetical protein
MAQARQQRKKKALLERFGAFLDEVFTVGPRFSMEALRKYEETGREAIEQRETFARVTPRPVEERESDILGELVFTRVREKEHEGAETVRAPMTRQALDDTLTLAQKMETAERGRDLNLREWTEREEGVA